MTIKPSSLNLQITASRGNAFGFKKAAPEHIDSKIMQATPIDLAPFYGLPAVYSSLWRNTNTDFPWNTSPGFHRAEDVVPCASLWCALPPPELNSDNY